MWMITWPFYEPGLVYYDELYDDDALYDLF